MAKKSKRSRLDWHRILIVLLVGNVTAGLFFSPATAVTRVKIVNGDPADAKRLLATMQILKDVPSVRVNAARLEDMVLTHPSVLQASLSRNLFGRGLLTLTYRRPVARVLGAERTMLSEDGKLIAWPRELPDLPQLDLPKDAPGAQTSVCGTWQMGALAGLCSKLSATTAGPMVKIVQLEASGQVSLLLGEGNRAVLGFPDDLAEKFRRLEAFLADGSRKSGRFELNLVTPSRPVSRRL